MESKDKKDDFWDLSSLMPKKQPAAPVRRFATRVATAEVTSGREDTVARPPEEGRLTVTGSSAAETEVREYTPTGNGLILSVRIVGRASDYNFYGQFRRDAIRLLHEEGRECEYASFFSYIPQYTQLNAAQKAYYLYWRSQARQGNFLRCDESYFYLYAYEIINLPDYIPPKEGIELLCTAWAAYRKKFPRTDKYMVEWVTDYCLIHELPCPMEYVRPFLREILPLASFKEFYLGSLGELTQDGLETALAFFSDYHFRESRYAKGKDAALLEECIFGALRPVIGELFADAKLLRENSTRSHRAHEAFCGSLCAHNVKRRIELTYFAAADVAAFRTSVTAAVKYAENKFRAARAVKSRLSVASLDAHCRELIDAYFDRKRDTITPPKAKEEPPAYEKLYDAPTRGTDPAAAREIELRSWATTRILVSEEEAEEVFAPAPVASTAPPDETAKSPVSSSPFGLTEGEIAYLAALLDGRREDVRRLLSSATVLEDEMAASVNEKVLAEYGDVILEADENGYRVIPDYEEEVSLWIQPK